VISRRKLLKKAGFAALAASLGVSVNAKTQSGRVVIIGGGFGGASCARALKALSPATEVTLIAPGDTYYACPFSNLVLAGVRRLQDQAFGYATIEAEGILRIAQKAVDVDSENKRVIVEDGTKISYDRLIMSPGIDLNFDVLPGYDRAAAALMPHAWQAGVQTEMLAAQLRNMPKGGVFAMSIPDNPYRCPPGPYERASLVAHYSSKHNPTAKILLLDAKDTFSKQALFTAAWREKYGDMIEWQGLSQGARVTSVNPEQQLVQTDFDAIKVDVANIIPPQRAADIAQRAGVTNASGWCPINAQTFESELVANIHVIGDATIANAMPKSAFAANVHAKVCAAQVTQLMAGEPPLSAKLINTCYSLVAPDYGISVAGVYEPEGNRFREIAEAGGSSPLNADASVRQKEAGYAHHWFNSITAEAFG